MGKVKWGVLGTASIAKGCTIPGMKMAENCELCGIAGRSLEKAKQFQNEFGFEKAYGSYEELLADEEIQAVYIPLPNHLHYEWVVKALQAGKHVLCEKPMAPTEQETKELFEVAKQNGVILMEAFAYLHSPFVKAVKEDLAQIGNIRYMESAFMTSYYDASNIRLYKEMYGGATYDLGCYSTSMILWMLDQEPDSIQAVAEFTEEGVDRFTTAYMKFGEIRTSLNCGMVFAKENPRRMDRLYIHGDHGEIKSYTGFNEDGELYYTLNVDGKIEEKSVFSLQNYRLEVEQLGRCILEGEKPHVSEEFSIKNARVIDGILKAIQY